MSVEQFSSLHDSHEILKVHRPHPLGICHFYHQFDLFIVNIDVLFKFRRYFPQVVEINCAAFVIVVHPESLPDFKLWVLVLDPLHHQR
jgi:hypothetical protein